MSVNLNLKQSTDVASSTCHGRLFQYKTTLAEKVPSE